MISSSLTVYRKLKTVQVRLIPDVGDLFRLSALDQIGNIIDDGLNARGIKQSGLMC